MAQFFSTHFSVAKQGASSYTHLRTCSIAGLPVRSFVDHDAWAFVMVTHNFLPRPIFLCSWIYALKVYAIQRSPLNLFCSAAFLLTLLILQFPSVKVTSNNFSKTVEEKTLFFRSFNFLSAYMSEIGRVGFLFLSNNFRKSICYLFSLSVAVFLPSFIHAWNTSFASCTREKKKMHKASFIIWTS